MLTGPVAAARAAVATGAWVKSKHMYLIREVSELKLYFYPSAGGFKKKVQTAVPPSCKLEKCPGIQCHLEI